MIPKIDFFKYLLSGIGMEQDPDFYQYADLIYKPADFMNPHDCDIPNTSTLILNDNEKEDLCVFLKTYNFGTEYVKPIETSILNCVYFVELGLYLYITAGEFADISNHIVNNYNQTPRNINAYQVYYSDVSIYRFNDTLSAKERSDQYYQFSRLNPMFTRRGNYPLIWNRRTGDQTCMDISDGNYNSDKLMYLSPPNIVIFLPLYIIHYDFEHRNAQGHIQIIMPLFSFQVYWVTLARDYPPNNNELVLDYYRRIRRFGCNPADTPESGRYVKGSIGNKNLYIRGTGDAKYFMIKN